MSVQAHNYANGIDPSPVKAEPEEAKGYSNSVTLEDDVRDIESANSILLALSDSVTRHMRRDGAKAFNVSVTIRYLDFKTRSHQKQLRSSVETTNAVYEIAKQLLSELWKDCRPLRLMGISLTNLTKENSTGIQMSLFGEDLKIDSERDQKLDKAIDAIRGRFGSESVKRATVIKDGLNVAKKFKGEEDSSK